ncbi:ribonuclease P protein component [Reinekea marina]|uniref:Ribonuclease P protein component n=1 Tax=Reinekea marina TaxID=1310421 RepID=A0ABV7WNV9_9GAMM|nr:ribonuclease P protein component [Reinekea marina]MDN3647671.1 ribonuclease P protein component [Reinekea marina]
MAEKTFGFPRRVRLLTAADFRTVFDQVDVKAPSPNCLLLAKFNETKPRLGFIISKKNVKNATDRNRVKRFARDYFRLNQSKLPNLDIIFMGRKGLSELSDKELHELIEKQFKKLAKRANKNLNP